MMMLLFAFTSHIPSVFAQQHHQPSDAATDHLQPGLSQSCCPQGLALASRTPFGGLGLGWPGLANAGLGLEEKVLAWPWIDLRKVLNI